MAQGRSAEGIPDPARISNRTQLAAALKAIKGGRTHQQLTDGEAPDPVNGSPSRGWAELDARAVDQDDGVGLAER